MRRVVAFTYALAFGALVSSSVTACSTGSASSPCETSTCAAGNTCISVAGAPATCNLACATHTDCPFNYHCDANRGGTSPYCALDTTTFPDKPGTQFNAPCNPSDGFKDNPGCDTADGFYCNAASPLDGNAFCTYFGCTLDTDCGDGDYCGMVNAYPNAASAQVTNGQTLAACLPRGYCTPCASDIDCAPANGLPQHCLAGTDGATFCTPECQSGSECALDATCASQGIYSACMPRAGVCKGDGTLCAPCRSDADCTNGFCLLAYNSTEHFCSAKSGITCSYDSSERIVDQCPAETTATATIGCSTSGVEATYPPNQCIGEVMEGTTEVEGCWSVH